MTGWGSVDTAVEAMRRGASSFVQKPWEDVTLLEILQREIEEAQATKRSDAKHQREFEDARLIQRGLLPTATPQLAGLQLASSWQPAERRRRRLLRHADVRRRRDRRLHRRRRRQGRARGAADVEPPGRGPRLRAGRGGARLGRAPA